MQLAPDRKRRVRAAPSQDAPDGYGIGKRQPSGSGAPFWGRPKIFVFRQTRPVLRS